MEARGTPEERVATFAAALSRHGLDIVQAGPIAAYHAAVPPAFRLPFSNAHTIVLVGASRAVWPRFLTALAAEPARRQAQNPFDGWVAPLVEQAAADAFAGVAHDVHHYWEPPPRRVALQHLADALGVAGRAPCGLVVHRRFGLWLSLRAAVVVEQPADEVGPIAPWPCASCADQPCVPALAAALAQTPRAQTPRDRPADHAAIRASAAAWIAVRDACPVGREQRYSDGQLRWHYVHDRLALEEGPP